MQRLRAGIGWLAGWLAVSAAVATGLVAYTLAQGGAIHRVPVCRGPDANIFSIGIVAAAASAILVLAWWALGASSVPMALGAGHPGRPGKPGDRRGRGPRPGHVQRRVHGRSDHGMSRHHVPARRAGPPAPIDDTIWPARVVRSGA
jgi:hypothetical protein